MERRYGGLKIVIVVGAIVAAVLFFSGLFLEVFFENSRYLTGRVPVLILLLIGIFAALLGALTILAGIWFVLRRVKRPLDKLRDLVETISESESEELRQRLLTISGAAQMVAEPLAEQLVLVMGKEETLHTETVEETEQRCLIRFTEELYQGIFPPPVTPEGPVQVAGLAVPKNLLYSRFDYVTPDSDLLCLMIGQIEGEDVDCAIRMVMAQAVFREMAGAHSLEETMAELSVRLHGYIMRVLIGTLRLSTGHFRFINAGCPLPLLMRKGEEYVWIGSRSYTALGVEERSSWQAEELEIQQKDRLFFCTQGLSDCRNQDGALFSEKALRATLNRSWEMNTPPDETLCFVADEAAAFCATDSGPSGYVDLLLEYHGESRLMPRCDLEISQESEGRMTAFLKHQFESAGLDRRRYARLIVLSEELFALCCRHGHQRSKIRTFCTVEPESGRFEIRMVTNLSGVNPLEDNDMPAETAAQFIRDQADEVRFERGDNTDTIVMVCHLDE